MGTTVEDFENKECDQITLTIDEWVSKSCELGDPESTGFALVALIKVLVSNGTLTAAQTKRALGKAD